MHFTLKIAGAIQELLDNEDSEFHISKEELKRTEDSMTEFITAVMVATPTIVYRKLTGQNINFLEGNHIANKLCVQYLMENGEVKE